MEKISGIGSKGEDVWTEKHGKRSELPESIQRDGPRYNYHMWVHQWTRWQYDLDAETFDGTHGTHCNQLVALVLHSPRERAVEGGNDPSQWTFGVFGLKKREMLSFIRWP